MVGAWMLLYRGETVLPLASASYGGKAVAITTCEQEGRTFFGPGASPAFSGNDGSASRW